ncbi:MAG: murein biosynthesis integral membrane protein MurJ [Actinomycetota bacterium]
MADIVDPPTGPLPRFDAGADTTQIPQAQRVSFARASAVMSVGTALSRVSGFGRVAVQAWAIGATESKLADTYNLANSMPNMVYQLVIGEVLSTIFVPVFVEHIKRRKKDESWYLASSILNIAVVFAVVFSIATVIAAPWLIKIFTFNADPRSRAQQGVLGAFFLRIFMPQMAFYAAGMIWTGLLQAYRKFGPPMFAPIVNNVIVIVTFVIFRIEHGGREAGLTSLSTGEKYLLAGGTTLGVIAMTLVLLPSVRHLPGRLRLRAFAWRDPAVRHVGGLAKYSLGFVASNQIALWAIYALANHQTGGVTVYNFAWILFQLPYGIFAVSVSTYILRELSEHHTDGNTAAMRSDLALGLRTISFIMIPAAAGFIALSVPMIRVLLQHGHFGVHSTRITADTFALMALGLPGFAAFQHFTKVFYAMQDTKSAFWINNVTSLVNVATAVPLFAMLHVAGLGLSFGLSYVAGALVGAEVLRRRLGGIDGKRLVMSHARTVIASTVTAAGAFFTARWLDRAFGTSHFVQQLGVLVIAVVVGLAIYLATARLLGSEELRPLVGIFTGRLRRKAR